MIKKGKIMWGITFILAAALIVAEGLGYLGSMSLFGLIISVLLVPVIITNIIYLDFPGFLFPLAIIGIIYAKPLGIEKLSPWPILLIAVLLSIGLSFIFPNKGHRKMHSKHIAEEVIDGNENDELNFEAKFTGSVKYVNAKNIKNVNIDCSFGGLKVYFDHADINEAGANINFNLSFSGAEIYIPRSWEVINNVNCIVGGVEVKGVRADNTDKKITLNGKVSFAGITIIYV
ncbi:MAG: hypothetical protein Q8882_01900 [Bacillota bacterium]|nr:hypothetical protein [Bacillota bacterium]